MTSYVNTSQSFFPATHVIAQRAHEQSSHCSHDRGYAWTQLHGFSLTKANLAKAITECPIWQQQRPTLGPLQGTIPLCSALQDVPQRGYSIAAVHLWVVPAYCTELSVNQT